MIPVLLITSCEKSDRTNNVVINSHEIFDAENPASKVHINQIASEYLDIHYDGEKHYNLDIEIWEKGKLVDTIRKAMDIALADYQGLSIEIDDSNPLAYAVIIGMYSNGGATAIRFDVDMNADNANGTFESNYVDERSIADDIEVPLWGYHKFNDMTSPYADVYDAAKNTESSIVLKLSPMNDSY
jgi:hypothetical protein